MSILSGIKTAEIPTSSGFPTRPFKDLCTIKTITDKETRGGTKYLEVILISAGGFECEGTYWLPNGKDEAKDKWKLGKIKELLTHAQVNMSLPEDKLIENAIGKKINCAFQSEQYIKSKDDQRPSISTKIILRFTNPPTKPFEDYVNEDYLTKKLDQAEWNKLISMQNGWDKSHPGAASASAIPSSPAPSGIPAANAAYPTPQAGGDLEDDDLPF
jgi:hypothetical protein